MKTVIFLILFLIVSLSEIIPAESINKLYAIVGKYSISQLDYEKAEEKFNKLFKGKSPYKGSPKTQVMNFLIERHIVDITADEETINVNEKRVEAEIDKIMESSGITDRALFEKNLSERTGVPFDVWVSELPYQIKKGQLLQVRVPVKGATEAEIKDWYRKNSNRIGFEFKFKEIVIQPKNSSFEEEQRISNELNQILKEVRKDKTAFTLIAAGPRNSSSARAGHYDWVSVTELFTKNKVLVNQLATIEQGGVSGIFRDDRGRYCIVKLEGKRPTPIESLRKPIQDILQREKMEESFAEWIKDRRKEITMIIYDKEYIQENKLETPDEAFNFDKVQDK